MSDSNREEFAVDLGPDSVKVTVGGSSAKALGIALYDLLSPFSNATGFIGDRLADVRREAAIKAAAKAKALLEKDGITTGNVPPKVLLPWLDSASLEQEETLQNAWAGLLARAVKSADAVNVSYIDTLKRLGKKEAELLQFFATDTSPFYSIKFYNLNQTETFSQANPLFENVIRTLDTASTAKELDERMNVLGMQVSRQIIFYSVNGGAAQATQFFDENEHAIANLEHLGLISIKRIEFDGAKRRYLLVWFDITKYGFDLFWACQGELTGGWRNQLAKQRDWAE